MTGPDRAEAGLVVQVLTCARSPEERMKSATLQLADLCALRPGLNCRFVHGFIDSDTEVDRVYDSRRNRKWAKRSMTRSEIATYAGHRKAWRELVESERAAALVLEDDFLIADPAMVLQCIDAHAALLGDGRHIVKLFDFPNRKKSDRRTVADVAGMRLTKWYRPRAGMVAYLISREGAERFLSRPQVFRVVDEDIKHFWELALDIWSVEGNPIEDNGWSLGGSLLNEGRDRNRVRSLGRSIRGNLLALHRKIRNHLANRRWPRGTKGR